MRVKVIYVCVCVWFLCMHTHKYIMHTCMFSCALVHVHALNIHDSLMVINLLVAIVTHEHKHNVEEIHVLIYKQQIKHMFTSVHACREQSGESHWSVIHMCTHNLFTCWS